MTIVFRQYSDRTTRAIREVLEREKQRLLFGTGSARKADANQWKQVRWVRTTTNSDFPTYPASTKRKFVVEFGTYLFDDTDLDGDLTLVFDPDEPAVFKIAYSHVGWIASGTVTRATLHDGEWHILQGS